MPNLHHHDTDLLDRPVEVRYLPQPPARRPNRLVDALIGAFCGALGTIIRLALVGAAIVAIVVGLFVGGFALLGKAIEAIPQSPTTTTQP